MRKTLLIIATLLSLTFVSCKEEIIPLPPDKGSSDTKPEPEPEPEEVPVYLKVDEGLEIHALNMSKSGDEGGIIEYTFRATGADPYFHLEKFAEDLDPYHVVLDFEYKLNSNQEMQIYYCTPGASEAKSVKMNIAAATSWTRKSYDMELDIEKFDFGKAGHRIRLDIGNDAGVNFSLRKIHIRKATAAEQAGKDEAQDKILAKKKKAADIKKYLTESYSEQILGVNVNADKVVIMGMTTGSDCHLVEIMPSGDITDSKFVFTQAITAKGGFNISFNRFVSRDGFNYDRLLSRWALAKEVDGKFQICSHARYADQIPCTSSMAEVKMKTKKGLGGFFGPASQVSDLDDLGISSVTVNVTPNTFLRNTSSGTCYTHTYGGRTYYISKSQIDTYDKNLKTCASRGIVVSAIILIQRTAADPSVQKAIVHPDCNGGNYSMPNMTTTEGIQTYAAMLDFLAKRYSPADGSNGCIHNWIMHNEVDAASTWTNMGSAVPEILVTNEYEKSMRMCYNIARQYYPHAKVLASFTHTWTSCDNADGYTAKSMLTDLVNFSSVEGDYQWGVAAHPYPQNLLEPCLWNKDTGATYSMESGFVTFKNLEVLDKWIRTPKNMYNGTIKRELWLSENGTNAKSYNAADLANQAAGAAWALKKVYKLEGIDGIQWHNWWDHPDEVAQGLRIGLRDSDQKIKPVWYVYQAAGTSKESEVFDQYLPVIGISSWNEIHHSL
ncbi:MAG: DUF5722 domain-containing protein [Bacteroidales bacterium]|nr:DUF5722 domain-containing protein [Bacteroidales bacterium]